MLLQACVSDSWLTASPRPQLRHVLQVLQVRLLTTAHALRQGLALCYPGQLEGGCRSSAAVRAKATMLNKIKGQQPLRSSSATAGWRLTTQSVPPEADRSTRGQRLDEVRPGAGDEQHLAGFQDAFLEGQIGRERELDRIGVV